MQGIVHVSPDPPVISLTIMRHGEPADGICNRGIICSDPGKKIRSARDLKMDYVHQGIQDKLTVFEEILRQEGIRPDEAAFVGDDVIDLPVMRNCGLAIAVANAREEVKRDAHFVTPHGGGDGAARDAVEYILKAQGKWKRFVSEYICERSPQKTST